MALEPSKLRDSSLDELVKEEKELREQMWKLQLQKSTGQIQDPQRMRGVRRDLARVLDREAGAEIARREKGRS